jgi:DNA gyrase/topoisomerase IV subunit B
MCILPLYASERAVRIITNSACKRFRGGNAEAPLAIVGDSSLLDRKWQRAIEIMFLPSPKIFTKTESDFTTLEHRLRKLACPNSAVTIVLADDRGAERKSRQVRDVTLAEIQFALVISHCLGDVLSRRCEGTFLARQK